MAFLIFFVSLKLKLSVAICENQVSQSNKVLPLILHNSDYILTIYFYVYAIKNSSSYRWIDHIPMSPMEGCPTVFQVIYDLMPGYHQVSVVSNW